MQTHGKKQQKRHGSARTARDIYPSWFPWKRYSTALVLLLFSGYALLAWQNRQKKKAQKKVLQKQKILLPSELYYKDGRLKLHCKTDLSRYRIARKYYDFSRIYPTKSLERALSKLNPEVFYDGECQKGENLYIPEPVIGQLNNRPLGWPSSTPIKAIYIRGDNFLPMRTTQELARLKERGLNAIVFDAKDILGIVNYRSFVPRVEAWRHHPPPIPNLPKAIRFLHDNGIYVIARMALFQDRNLAENRVGLAIRDTKSPTRKLLVKGRPLWVDPAHPTVQGYNLAIVDELVKLGVDEIQFDYVRYPAEGDLSGVVYRDVKNPADKTRHLVDFLSAAWLRTRLSQVRISIDIFGIVAWGEEIDIRATGQRIPALAVWVDVISPMLYPSHFNRGFDGFASPADEGLHFYEHGVKKVLELSQTANPHLVVRPWIQAFRWRVTNYNENYILEQIRGSYLGGGNGWLMWNASNQYEIVYRALKNGHPEGQIESSPEKHNRLTLE